MTILETKNLCKNFSGKPAVVNASLTLEPGKIYGLLGPNGSGKSTFMKMVSGLFYPTKGDITIMGSPVSVSSKSHVAYMPTEPFFYSYMNIKMVGNYHKDFYEDFNSSKFEQLVSNMGLEMDMKVGNLSSGMAAKLKIASTMARDAKLYMLDEPLNGIDLVARDKIMTAILENTGDQKSMIISSHLVDEIEKILDEVIFIKDGEIIIAGPAEAIRSERGKSIVDLYREVYA